MMDFKPSQSMIPPSVAFVSPMTWNLLKKHCEESQDKKLCWSGIRIEVEESAEKRKLAAMSMTMTEGETVMYEGENGEMFSVSMPTPSFSMYCRGLFGGENFGVRFGKDETSG